MPREGREQTCISESPLPKCFGAKLCIRLSVICIFGSPKTDATFGDDFKGRVQKYLCIKQREWEQFEVALHKVALRTRPVEGCPCARLPCQSVLGLNCVYLCLLIIFLGHQKQMQLLAIISKGGFKNIFA